MFETLEDIWEFLCVHFCILGILQFRLPGEIRIEAMLTVREKKKLKFSSNTWVKTTALFAFLKIPLSAGDILQTRLSFGGKLSATSHPVLLGLPHKTNPTTDY